MGEDNVRAGEGSGHRVARGRTKVSGLLGPASRTLGPARVEGTEQCGGEVMPPSCPRCHATGVMWVCDAVLGSCRACGADYYLTRYTVGQPRQYQNRGNPHPEPIT